MAGNEDDIKALRNEIAQLRAQLAQMTECARESQDWNWLSAHEAMESEGTERYPVDEMQELHDIAFGEGGPVEGSE